MSPAAVLLALFLTLIVIAIIVLGIVSLIHSTKQHKDLPWTVGSSIHAGTKFGDKLLTVFFMLIGIGGVAYALFDLVYLNEFSNTVFILCIIGGTVFFIGGIISLAKKK